MLELLTLDRTRKKLKRPDPRRGPTARYVAQLKQVAQQVGMIVGGFEPGAPDAAPKISDILARYAEALGVWAETSAMRMLSDVESRELKDWKENSAEMGRALANEIRNAPTGEVMRELLADQVTLIKSIPLQAAKRVHELTLKGIEDGTRFTEIAKEIQRTTQVTESRAILIARTEVGRASTALMQARAAVAGSVGYVWTTSHDGDVRPSHKAMSGKFVEWDNPPTLDGLTGHAGALPNCRCRPRVVWPE